MQDGCDNFCAYCTVPFARGRSRNIAICEVVKMAQNIAAEGVKEVVLTGVNTGDFGRTTGESFLDLLKALNEVEGIERYRISSIEPTYRCIFKLHLSVPASRCSSSCNRSCRASA